MRCGDAVREDPGLAGPGTGDDQHRSVRGGHGQPLLLVQPGQQVRRVGRGDRIGRVIIGCIVEDVYIRRLLIRSVIVDNRAARTGASDRVGDIGVWHAKRPGG